MRAALFMRNRRMRVGSHWAWYWRWLFNVGLMACAGLLVWWAFSNQHKITGFNPTQLREQVDTLASENLRLTDELAKVTRQMKDSEQQTAIEKATQTELSKNVVQLQDENSTLKEDLGFMRKMMGGGGTEAIAINQLQVEREPKPNEFRYRMVVTQGGERKHDFKGKLQLVARVQKGGALTSIVLPEEESAKTDLDFKFFQRIEGKFSVPDGSQVKGLEVRVLVMPGGQVRLTRNVALS